MIHTENTKVRTAKSADYLGNAGINHGHYRQRSPSVRAVTPDGYRGSEVACDERIAAPMEGALDGGVTAVDWLG